VQAVIVRILEVMMLMIGEDDSDDDDEVFDDDSDEYEDDCGDEYDGGEDCGDDGGLVQDWCKQSGDQPVQPQLTNFTKLKLHHFIITRITISFCCSKLL